MSKVLSLRHHSYQVIGELSDPPGREAGGPIAVSRFQAGVGCMVAAQSWVGRR